MKKRVLSLLMAIAICLSMLPSAALAEIPGTGTNEVQTEQQFTDEQIPEEQKPDEQKPEQQIPEQQKPEEQKPEEQKPDKQNPDEQKPAKAPRKAPAAETHTGDHGGYTLPEGATWQGVSSLPSDSGYYYLTDFVTISSTWKPADGTVLCLNGYGISMAGNGPVIHVQPGVTFTLCDCNGSQNQYIHGITHGGNGKGAGVLVGRSATDATAGKNTAEFNMYGGAIYNNYPWEASGENAASASGVLIGGGTFNMYGGKITGNKLTEDGGLGGGVFVANQGSFYMSGGEISGNTAKEGGGVFVGGLYGYHDFSACSGGTFTMSGGSITGNSGTGGGVYVSAGSDVSFTVSGSAQITGNTGSNVYLNKNKGGESNTIKVDGTLENEASIGVSVETANQVVAENISAENAKRFTSDNKKYSLKYDSTSQTLTLVGHDNHPICGKTCTHGNKHDVITNWRSISTEAELNAVIMGGCYYLTQDVEIEDPWSPANGVTLCLNGHSITLVGRDHSSVIKVESGTFTLCDCSGDSGKITNGYKDGGSQKYPGRGVSVSKNGTFTMNGGSITGNTEGGVFVGSNRTFTMNGGSITGNTVTGSGGGVYVASGAEFTMNGGEITGNTSSTYGGGVYVYRNAEFTMTDGEIIDNAAGGSNTSNSHGGGVFVQNDAIKFTMTGGNITRNKAKYGGGVWTGASFTVSGNVNITGNVGIDGKTASNVYPSLGTITIGGKGLKPEAKIGVTYSNTIPTGEYVTIATGANNPDLNYGTIFSCDNGSQYVVSKDGDSLFLGLHRHNWSYTANGATITAMCTADGCPLENKNGGSYTITAPDNLIYDGNGKAATVTGSIPDVTAPTITYKKGDTTLGSAPTDVGKYTASITLGEGENAKTARVEYSITQATPTYDVPTGLTAKYGQTLADISLPTGWAWKDATQSVGSVGEKTFKATYTPDDANFHAVTDIDVTVTVNKAPVTIQITGMPKGPIAYGDTFVLTITQTGDSNAVPENWTKFSRDRHFEYLREQSNPEKGEFKFRATGVCPGKGCSQKFTVEFESDTHNGSLTVSTPNVTKKTLTGEDLVFGGLPTDFTKIYDGSTSFTKARVEIRSGAKVNVTDVLPAVNGSYVYNSKDVKDAKKVIFTSEKTESENYILPAGLVVEREAKIEPAAITVTPNAVSKTYGAADPELTYGVSGAVNSETPAFTGALARAEGKNVGDYAINQGTLALADKDTFKAGNYKLKFTSKVNLTITKAKPEITAASKQITKNGVEVDITGWASFNNTDSNAKLTYTLVGRPIGITLTGNKLIADPSTTVLTFVIKVSAEATANFTAPDEVTFTVTVVNKDDAGVIITGAPTEKTYGDADFTVTAASGVTESTGNNGKWTWASSDDSIMKIVSGADSATATVQVLKASATGATLTATYSSITHYGTANVTIKVNPKDVTITGLSAGNKDYDRSTSATPTGTAVIDGKVGSDDVTVTAGTASFDNENVGTDKTVTFTGYSLSGADAGNYNLKAQPASVTANIAAKEVTITSLTAANRSYQKDNLSVALISGTLTGVITGDTVTIDLTNAKGTMTDANAGTGKAVTVTGVALGGADKDNYRLKEQPTGVTVNITKATAPTLKNITVSQKYSVTTGEKAIGTVMPADAGTLTYTKGAESKTGSVTVTSWAVDSTGKVTYTLSGGAAGDTVTLPVIIKSTNYADATVNVVITLTAKDIPNVTAKDIVVTYDGNPIPADKITGTADVAGTWEWKAGTAVTNVSDSGPKTVVFKPADSVNYAEVEKTITVTINRATPTGEPKYTEIKTGGKTLADAALMLAGGTIPFDEGALEWIDEKGNKLSDETVVEANKSYTWRFTPANTNYTTLIGTIVLYPASTGIVIYTPVNDAIFLSGANQIVAPGSAATFRINKNFGEFRSVAVDGVTLDKSNYRAWSGSTYVKLTPAYMKTLSAGTHTLAVYFTGATATTTFTISAGSSNPATGASDFVGVGAAVAMAVVSLLGAAAVLRRK